MCATFEALYKSLEKISRNPAALETELTLIWRFGSPRKTMLLYLISANEASSETSDKKMGLCLGVL